MRSEIFVEINSTIIKGSDSYNGLIYSEDRGKTWSWSNITFGDFQCLTTIGNIVVATIYSINSLYYSEDNGHNWSQSKITIV